jgi:hypothetical protein
MNIEYVIDIPALADPKLYESRSAILFEALPELAKSAEIILGAYQGLIWATGTGAPIIEDATTWGTKMLPGAGPFYFANTEEGTPTLAHLDIPEPALEPSQQSEV